MTEQIAIEQLGTDKFRLSVDGVSGEFTESKLRTELEDCLREHARNPRDFADELIHDTEKLCRIELNLRARATA